MKTISVSNAGVVNSAKSIVPYLLLIIASAAFAVSLIGCAESVPIRRAPPPLPVYDQPYCPGPGYIWVPGYWAYGSNGYFWVPGTWEPAPNEGWMWTPGYWGCSEGAYYWHSGYWGRHVGYYGGINYGYGYTGTGYEGGYWKGKNFYYNSAVSNVNPAVVINTYKTPPLSKVAAKNPVSYNGGEGGTTVKPTAAELVAVRDPHIAATPHQKQLFHASVTDRKFFASENHGQPRADLLAKQAAPAMKKNPKQQIKKKDKARKQERQKKIDQGTDPAHSNSAQEKDGTLK